MIEKKRKRFEKDDGTNEVVHCQVDKLIVATNENGSKPYNNSTIIDLILGIFFAGHNTPAIAAMWALLHISQNPHIFQMAKVIISLFDPLPYIYFVVIFKPHHE